MYVSINDLARVRVRKEGEGCGFECDEVPV